MSNTSLLKRRGTSMTAVAALVGAGLVALGVASAPQAAALLPGPAPISEPTANNVTADALPTVQIDGVVWSQAIVGNTVFAGGNFSHARPAGAAAGTNLTPRSDLLSYDLTTGVLNTSFAPTLNGQVKAVAASPDGSRIYVGGQFTTVNGVTRDRIAAFDAGTGTLISTFKPIMSTQVNAIVATDTTVYVGGAFTTANGVARNRLAAFNAVDGSLTVWDPNADFTVNALVITPDGSRVVAGGAFQNVGSQPEYGLAAVDATGAGGVQPWAANEIVRDAGTDAAIESLSTDGTAVYGTGYVFGAGGNLEGTFSADPDSGAINWIEDCHGDTYGVFASGGVVYTVGHAHFCSNVGGQPETNPRSYHHAIAWTANAVGTVAHNTVGGYYDFFGNPAPSEYNWFPDMTNGTFTGQSQAAWDLTGNGQYVVMGGEFPTVNSTAQQGLVRFAVRPPAPGTQGPRNSGANFVPSVVATSTTTARVAWRGNWDRDNENLTYKVIRNNNAVTPVYTTTAASPFWNEPTLAFPDSGLSPGATYTYKIYAVDPAGNTAQGNNVSITMPATDPSPYVQQVLNDGAGDYWRLGESSGTTGADLGGFNNLVEGSSVAHGATGAVNGDSDTATTFDGTGTAGTLNSLAGPDTFTIESWIKTTSTSGGKIIGFGDAQSGASSSYDRHVYMDDAGHIYFGVFTGATRTVNSNSAYNDGQWHYVVASMSGAGMALYVDGVRVAVDGATTAGQDFAGYWRVGGDNLNGWPSRPTSDDFTGTIDEVALYPTALTAAQVRAHYTSSGRTLNIAPAPTDTYGQRVYNDNPDLYWRLDDASGLTAADTSPSNAPGVYSGAVTYHTPSPVTGSSGTGVTFDGVSGTIGSQQAYNNPTVYSEGLWFNTNTTHGGKLIGFGNQQNGLSDNYDRQVFMLNSGQLVFGVWTGQENLITSTADYNDGNWHQVVATQGSDGMTLYVDGQAVGTNPQTQAQAYTGYWRVGGDSDWGGDSPFFAGAIDEVAVYLSELTASQVQAQYAASPAVSPANQPPVARFTQSCTNLSCAFDGSTSSDPDGSVATYGWGFGDGATGVGVNPAHVYAAAGSYSVTLTVTDNQSATALVLHSVTVVAATTVIAADAFGRTVNNGWGSANTGGAWTVAGVASSNFSVAPGASRMQMPIAGNSPTAYLNGVSPADSNSRVDFTFDKAQTGTSYTYAYLAARHTGSSQYRLRAKLLGTGVIQLSLTKVVSGTETVVLTKTITGLTFTAGQFLRMRLQVSGTSSVTLAGKIWSAAATEPTSWQVTTVDATKPLGAGSPGLAAYLSSLSNNAPIAAKFANFTVGTITGP